MRSGERAADSGYLLVLFELCWRGILDVSEADYLS